MCDRCADCVYRKCIPATWEDPSEEYCDLDRDEFYSEEEVDCPDYRLPRFLSKEDYDEWRADNFID